MNTMILEILNIILNDTLPTKDLIINQTGCSLEVVNQSIEYLVNEEYIDDNLNPTPKAYSLVDISKPKNAIILAAGFGMRMVPINTECPKGLLEIEKEPIIERIIKQLHEVNIQDIYVVTGFMKESYAYLKDKYHVELIENEEYSQKNNLHSLSLVKDKIDNSYIIPCDIWCEQNPFRKTELYSWYMIGNDVDDDSTLRLHRNGGLYAIPPGTKGNTMLGICYLMKNEAEIVCSNIENMVKDDAYDNEYWESALFKDNQFIIPARIMDVSKVKDIDTFENLRDLDSDSNSLKSDAMDVIQNVFHVSESEITKITVLKKGMTNRSFLFECKDKKYIMRIPGEGTDKLIQRSEEADVYKIVDGYNLCDDVIYINPENGYKITEFFDNVHTCNPENMEEVAKCMSFLKKFHSMELEVSHEFDIYSKIEFYESLWDGAPSIYKDYKETKEHINSLKDYVEKHYQKKVLTHIDAVCDNFLFVKKDGMDEEIRLIDWEYAAMQDAHVDIAMFAIYALYDREQVDTLIDLYFENACPNEIRIKIYCYIAMCGLLWSNWCEYKRIYGIEFGEYAYRQYKYAKEYYKIALDAINKMGE